MVFKRPVNNRDDRPKRSGAPSKSGDTKRASSSRGKDFKSGDKPNNDTTKKRYSSGPDAERSSFSSGAADKKSFGPRKPYSGRPTGDEERPKRNYGEQAGDKFAKKKPYSGRPTSDSDRPVKRDGDNDRPRKSFGDDRPKKSFSDDRPKKTFGSDRPERKSFDSDRPEKKTFSENRPAKSFSRDAPAGRKPAGDFKKRDGDKPFRKTYDKPSRENSISERDAPNKTLRPKKAAPKKADDGLIRLNRYIANAGICSRRKADELIEAGVVSVNGVVVNELGLKVDPMKDEIRYNGETLKREKNVYVLLNKPKDYITTTEDPQERRTVMHLVEKASRERIYPVGRLDRNTTGLLLMTNDGDLADKLSHPRSAITKLYQVELSKALAQGDLNKLQFGIELEDGPIKPDAVSYVTGASKKEVGVQIHSGKNRIVRRMFEHLGYEVVKLDRVVYANLTKKDLPRGRWRYLDEKEIIQLKHLIK
ncbi:pseudouridine synthase [Mucilaginibacter sp. dw_454]|uniref:pseudouridine synthase n=1 Tax=Mucilaginibacter sp. dw_454 TaxID=2720079 RepID=UPI001BD56F58|nr:pseudouridine synthase [Mucilaginibacter sp. dw_454]